MRGDRHLSYENPDKQLVTRYERMLKNNEIHYFDVFEFESIVNWYLDNNQTEQADQVVSTAFRQHPQAPELKLKKAQLLFDKGNIDETYLLLKELERINANEYELLILLGLVYIVKEKFAKAEKYFRKGMGTDTDENYDTLYSAGLAYERAGAMAYAIRFMEEAASYAKIENSLLFDLAFNYERTEVYDLAAEKYLAYLDKVPFSANGWYNYGVVNNKLNKPELAKRAYEYALAINPLYSSAWYNMGNLLANQNEYNQALKSYFEYLKLEEPNVDLFCYIAECYERLNRYDEAKLYYQKSLQIDNEFADSLFGLGISYAYKKELKKAEEYVGKSLLIEPKNATYLFAMAQIKGGLQKFEEAIEMFNLSIKYDAADEETWLKYASFVNKSHSLHEALLILDRALREIPLSKSLKFAAEGLYLQAQNIETNLDPSILEKEELAMILSAFAELEAFLPPKDDE